jgi:hypothetical protein
LIGLARVAQGPFLTAEGGRLNFFRSLVIARNNHLRIYQDGYRFSREIFRLKQKFPKTLKYDLGEKLGNSSLTLMRAIAVANGSRDKIKPLQTMALEIDVLWVYLRMAHDFQGIKRGEYQVVSEILSDISRQHKAWLSWAREASSEANTIQK